jgi:hypothetical protein
MSEDVIPDGLFLLLLLPSWFSCEILEWIFLDSLCFLFVAMLSVSFVILVVFLLFLFGVV